LGASTLRVIGRCKLNLIRRTDEPLRKWLVSWLAEIENANWRRPSDVIGQFPKAQMGLSDNRFVFSAERHRAEIHVIIGFSRGVALITAVKISEVSDAA
jgi:mRNA-degrading endonuclease HigB of HigAB toxin-antitoxin module